MEVRNVTIRIGGLKSALREAAEVMEKVKLGEKVTPKSSIGFESIDTLRKVLTPKRLELLKVIKEKLPDSIYELSKIVDRDLKSVTTDVKVLEEYWLVSLEKSEEGRMKVKPEVGFDKLNIEIALA
ncbi:hypothetical protein HYY73_00105 [Candidatus Woesearchaeota archaeon]|nr:hypothetical protein [Candidatus Woesearchaeota archaeon]